MHNAHVVDLCCAVAHLGLSVLHTGWLTEQPDLTSPPTQYRLYWQQTYFMSGMFYFANRQWSCLVGLCSISNRADCLNLLIVCDMYSFYFKFIPVSRASFHSKSSLLCL